MEPLILPSTANTPYVHFDPTTGILEMRGRSTPENPSEYYARMMRWVDQYTQHPREETEVRTYFEYFNTSSSKCLLELMKKIKTLRNTGHAVNWVWMYEPEDEDMREAGSDFSDLLKDPFSIVVRP